MVSFRIYWELSTSHHLCYYHPGPCHHWLCSGLLLMTLKYPPPFMPCPLLMVYSQYSTQNNPLRIYISSVIPVFKTSKRLLIWRTRAISLVFLDKGNWVIQYFWFPSSKNQEMKEGEGFEWFSVAYLCIVTMWKILAKIIKYFWKMKNLKNRNGDVYYVHEWKDSISTLSNCLRGSFNMPVRKHMQGYSLKHWL